MLFAVRVFSLVNRLNVFRLILPELSLSCKCLKMLAAVKRYKFTFFFPIQHLFIFWSLSKRRSLKFWWVTIYQFWAIYMRSPPSPRAWQLSAMLSSGCSVLLALTYRAVICADFFFFLPAVSDKGYRSTFIREYPAVLALCTERTVVPPELPLVL